MRNPHEIVEKNVGLLTILILVAISFGALVQITPLMFQQQTMEPVEGLKPYTALQLEGRDIYIREGCVGWVWTCPDPAMAVVAMRFRDAPLLA